MATEPSPQLLTHSESIDLPAGAGYDNRIGAGRNRFLIWLQALRAYQWSKNLLVFVPLFLSHNLLDRAKLLSAFEAFVAFSLCCSAVYVVNDLADLQADREHVRKRHRPFAARLLTPRQGIVAILMSLLVSAAVAALLPRSVGSILATYFLLSFAYTLKLKEFAMLDVLLLASFYSLRILAGGAASNIEVSLWTLAFSSFLFLGVAIAKRINELARLDANRTILLRRGYQTADLSLLRSFATSALYLSVLVFILYVDSPEVVILYHQRKALWAVSAPLIYWNSRLLLLANRGQLTDDPIVFALSDPVSYLAGVCTLGLIFLAI